MTLSIVSDFSRTPGFRFYSDGPFSGQLFRETKLEPLFEESKNFDTIVINLDGVAGYATSFLEEAFGGLARKYGKEVVLNRLTFISDEDPLLIEEIQNYIRNCHEKK